MRRCARAWRTTHCGSKQLVASIRQTVDQTRDLVDTIEPAIKEATEEEVQRAVKASVDKLSKDATLVRARIRKEQAAAAKKAAAAGAKATKPFDDARKVAGENVMKYLKEAQVLAKKVAELKPKAVAAATAALPFQSRGEFAEAQKRMMEAHAIMGEAMHWQGQAEAFNGRANAINAGEVGAYDLAGMAAKAYAAYQADPGASVGGYEVPLLPKPFRFG